MEIWSFALLFAIDLVVSAAFLWVGMKITSALAGMPGNGQFCSYADLMKVALAVSMAGLVPYVGWLLSFVTMYFMLQRVTGAEFRELWIMIVLSRIAAIFTVVYVNAAL